MNKKLLSFLLMLTMIMFIGIDVKAGCYTSYTCTANEGYTGTCPTYSSTTKCGSNCTVTANGCTSGSDNACLTTTSKTCYCPSITGDLQGPSGTISTSTTQSLTISAPANSGYTLSNCSSSSSAATIGTTGGTITLHANEVKSLNCKANVTITCTMSNGCTTKTGTVSFVVHRTDWKDKDNQKRVGSGQGNTCTDIAEQGGYNICFKNCNDVQGANGFKKRYCDTQGRGCGKDSPNPPPPACYIDLSTGFLWWDDSGKQYQTYNETTGKWDANNGYQRTNLDEDHCYTKFKCSIKNMAARNVETVCNGIHEPSSEAGTNKNELSGTYINKCGILYDDGTIGQKQADGTEKYLFYKITCEEKMKTAFNGPIFDNNSSFMYPGTGFGFNYFAKSIVSCKGHWDDGFYKNASYYINNYIKQRYNSVSFQEDNEDDDIRTAFYGSASNALEGVVNRYKSWKVNYYNDSKPTGTINDIQPDEKVQKKDWHLFNLVFNELSTDGASSCGDLPNGTLKDFNYQELHNIQMKLPILKYDKKAKYVSETDNQYKVSECTSSDPDCLGRIFPVSDSKEFAGSDYKYKVNVSKLGMGHNWTNYETCDITMKTKDVYFRQINLSDPFVQKLNPNRGIGYNWKNSKFNFVNLIDPNIWNKASEYNMVRITEEDGKNIKSELNTNKGYYTGICSSGSAAAASTICAKYNQAVSGK